VLSINKPTSVIARLDLVCLEKAECLFKHLYDSHLILMILVHIFKAEIFSSLFIKHNIRDCFPCKKKFFFFFLIKRRLSYSRLSRDAGSSYYIRLYLAGKSEEREEIVLLGSHRNKQKT
jgi:hypothetical protein